MSKQIIAAAVLARIACALPQQLDFNQIQAAPAVASGPAVIDADQDPAAQTASLYTSFAAPSPTDAVAQPTSANSKRELLMERDPYYYSSSSSSSSSSYGGSSSSSSSCSSSGSGWSSSSSSSYSSSGGSYSSSSSSSSCGSQCWPIGSYGLLSLNQNTGYCGNSGYYTGANNQITFTDATATLHMDSSAYYYNSQINAPVYNFGQGNTLQFSETIRSGNYNSNSGWLSLGFTSGTQVQMWIGSGYDNSKFSFTSNPSYCSGYNGIQYHAPCPYKPQPSKCTAQVPTCTAKPPPYSSTKSTPPPYTSPTSVKSTPPPYTSPTSVKSTPTPYTSPTTSVPATSPPGYTSGPATSAPTTSPTPTGGSSSYTPYYPALTTSYTTNPALTGTTTSGQACPTMPEAGTYCGFINPEDPCAPQPDGYGPVPTPDTAEAFLAYAPLHSMAQAAPTSVPSINNTQYTEVFKDLNASTSAQSYLGVYTFKTYDVTSCAQQCDANSLCTAFNIYAERDPSLNPSKNDSTAPTVWGYDCPNPASMTSFKCTLWGSAIDASTATNQGEYREDFHVVITASNGYDRTDVATPPDCSAPPTSSTPSSTPTPYTSTSSSSAGPSKYPTTTSPSSKPTGYHPKPYKPYPWSHPHNCHGKGIDAPKYFMGSRFFPGPFNPQVCSDFALAQNDANANAGSNSQCNMFNAAYLHKNNQPHGTYCALYSSYLDDSYATYTGGKSGNDNYSCRQSWTYSLL